MSSGVDVIARLTAVKTIYMRGRVCGSISGHIFLELQYPLLWGQSKRGFAVRCMNQTRQVKFRTHFKWGHESTFFIYSSFKSPLCVSGYIDFEFLHTKQDGNVYKKRLFFNSAVTSCCWGVCVGGSNSLHLVFELKWTTVHSMWGETEWKAQTIINGGLGNCVVSTGTSFLESVSSFSSQKQTQNSAPLLAFHLAQRLPTPPTALPFCA